MPAFNLALRDEYRARLNKLEDAIGDLENWLASFTEDQRGSFLDIDLVTNGGKVCVDDGRFMEGLEDCARTDDEDEVEDAWNAPDEGDDEQDV